MIPVAVFDTETTGINTENDRIVSAHVGVLDEHGAAVSGRSWLVDPGIEIPDGATAVHGITTAKARSEGQPAATAVVEIEVALMEALGRGLPIVVFNAPFDITILDREIGRHHGGRALAFTPMPIIDPLVLDKAMEKYRPGSRKLADVARHHGGTAFAHSSWHSAEADAIAAGRLAQLLILKEPRLHVAVSEIHQWQITWARRQAESFRGYVQRQGKDAGGVDGSWPVRARSS